jgi:RNA polymerase sigma factor (TIGR02999 family)
MSGQPPATAEVTQLLHAWRSGDEHAGEALLRMVYETLRRIASSQLRGERAGHTLQPTALVHEAFLRLLGQQTIDWRDRAHFFGLASVTMRRVLVDYARARNARKRKRDEALDPLTLATEGGPNVELLDLDRALTEFAERFPRQAKVVEMRYFGDLELEQVAVCLDVSPTTVKRDWTFARAWLRSALAASP